ncbi:MAG TPA: hypothetical protein VFB58_13315 [Chloroflexota bacterium]|nr:hypothetical protein [Chloroflexota bacterium]
MTDREAQAAREWIAYWQRALQTSGQSWMSLEDARRQLAYWRRVLKEHERAANAQKER